jgi:16S rRNA (guanine527-N7)-methyltransferase
VTGAAAWQVHVDDSLSALSVPGVAEADEIADIGSGAGFPGAVLAAALPGTRVDLIESSSRKCAYMRDAMAAAKLANVAVVCRRSEEWARAVPPRGGREGYDVVTVRAVGSLAADAELASPLLRDSGILVVWKGSRRKAEEDELARVAAGLAMEPAEVLAVTPYPESRDRHLHVLRKAGPTPTQLPRRPGAAAKHPLGA